MTFGPGTVVSAGDIAAAVVKRAIEAAPKNVSRAALGEAMVRAGTLLVREESGAERLREVLDRAWREATGP